MRTASSLAFKLNFGRAAAAAALLALGVAPGAAETVPTALKRAILTSVLQGTQSVRLPTSPQSATYRFDPALDTFIPSSQPGPTVLRSPATIREGSWSTRLAVSYFQLDAELWPTNYELTEGGTGTGDFYTAFGTLFTADITLIELAASYGATDRLELSLNVPISIVDLDAHFRWLYDPDDPFAPTGDATLAGLESRRRSGDLLEATRGPAEASFLGPQRFENGAQAGLGQIALGAKYRLLSSGPFELSPSYELLLPSPSEDEFAGPDGVGMTARVLSSASLASWAVGFVDAGYTYQIEFQELTGFVWDAGFSLNPLDRLALDLGAGGTVFAEELEPNPAVATAAIPGPNGERIPVEFTALDDTGLGANAVNFLFGVKYLIVEGVAASGGVVVPVTDDGIRPDAAGTIALEAYF